MTIMPHCRVFPRLAWRIVSSLLVSSRRVLLKLGTAQTCEFFHGAVSRHARLESAITALETVVQIRGVSG